MLLGSAQESDDVGVDAVLHLDPVHAELPLLLHFVVQALPKQVFLILHFILLLDLFVLVEFDEARSHFLVDTFSRLPSCRVVTVDGRCN